MGKQLGEIAALLGGVLDGPADLVISGATNIEAATASEITFAVPPHLEKAEACSAAAVIIPESVKQFAKPCIRVRDPRLAFAHLLNLFAPAASYAPGVDARAFVAADATVHPTAAVLAGACVEAGAVIGEGTVVYPQAYVGPRAVIGSHCRLYPQSVVREDCVLGDRVTLQPGAVIGGDGFGYVTVDGRHHKVPQVGNVILHDDVEVGCNACIDRATTGSTIIGHGTKIDNLVHLAHNDVVGENCFFVALTGISGSVTIGDNVTFAGQSGAAGHLTIGDNCVFAAKAGIISDVPAGSFYAGFPAKPHKEWLKAEAHVNKLADMSKRLKTLEARLAKVERDQE